MLSATVPATPRASAFETGRTGYSIRWERIDENPGDRGGGLDCSHRAGRALGNWLQQQVGQAVLDVVVVGVGHRQELRRLGTEFLGPSRAVTPNC